MEWFLKSRVLRIAGHQQFDASAIATVIRRAYYGVRKISNAFPRSASALRNSELFNDWWYYSVELVPGLTTKGIYPDEFPLLPRILMRNCDLDGAACLDLGSMEGLIPTLMCKQRAAKVLATDATFHCYEKMQAVKHYYNVHFNFQQIGSMYDLSAKLKRYGGFDFINLSGVLYHVFSPMHVLAGVRPLLKKNGLMIVSTNVINRPDYSAEFNDRGKLQTEANTFWYLSIPLFDYLLQFFRLAPIDMLYYPHSPHDPARYSKSFDAGYMAVVCRATDETSLDDDWGRKSSKGSWEIALTCDLDTLRQQPVSTIRYNRPRNGTLDLLAAVETMPLCRVERVEDSNTLRLSDRS
jgi:2-polyprenyl-3-methyl-5-hydroxy-6-metoxy-1,4-benzoquinol methylase